ncbi:4'-phosphopantetheinyl transferase family protein [Streptomyces misionensis]|uniref:4'-phosphopantetheinyl transferase family protein n=1 Tax=Streptomyces misionensis TaxID=67331 RepID=UPI0036B08B2E
MPVPADAAPRPVEPARTQVWWWGLPERVDPADAALLGPAEEARLRRFGSERAAASFARSRAAARRALGTLLGVPAAEVVLGRAECPGCGDPGHGPPRLVHPAAPLAISLSRTAGRGLLAVRAGARVGVDVEAVRAVRGEALARTALTPDERAAVLRVPPGPGRDRMLLRAWTRKEAVVKAVGTGLTGAPNRLETQVARPGPVVVAHRHGAADTVWSVADLDLGEGYVAAVATEGTAGDPAVDIHPRTHRDEDPS